MMAPPTALLVIDAQQGLLDGAAAVPDAPAVLRRLVMVLAAARSAGALVVHLQNDGASGTLDEPGTPGWFVHPKVAPAPGELVLRKRRDDAFDGTELEDVLVRQDVTCVAVAGLLSEMCAAPRFAVLWLGVSTSSSFAMRMPPTTWTISQLPLSLGLPNMRLVTRLNLQTLPR